MKRKYYLLPLLAAGLCLALSCIPRQAPAGGAAKSTAAPEVAAQSEMVLVLRHDGSEHSQTHSGALYFKERLEAHTGGALRVDVYPANQLGHKADTEYALRYGTVTLYMGEPLYDAMDCLTWTSLTGDADAFRGYLQGGAVRSLLDAESAENGALLLGTVSEEYHILSSGVPVRSVEDFCGLRVASTNASCSEVFWGSLGAELMESPQEHIFTAIQQNMAGAQEDVPRESLGRQISRYHTYVLLTNHLIAVRAVYVNRRFFADLTPEQQEAVERAIKELRQYFADSQQEEWQRLQVQLEGQGVSLAEPSPALQKEMDALTAEPVLAALRELHGDETVERILQAAL